MFSLYRQTVKESISGDKNGYLPSDLLWGLIPGFLEGSCLSTYGVLMLICSPLPNSFQESVSWHRYETWSWAESLSTGTHGKSAQTQETCKASELSMSTCIRGASPNLNQSRCFQSMTCPSSVAHKMLFSCTSVVQRSAGMHMLPSTSQELLPELILPKIGSGSPDFVLQSLTSCRKHIRNCHLLYMFLMLLALCGLFITLRSITLHELK